jgi:DNA-binding IclR family transcriptional regulator
LGIRIPLNIGAANKVMLAHMNKEEALKIINELVPIEEIESFLQMLNTIRHKGYGESQGERTKGTASIAAPIFNHSNELIGALSIGYVTFNQADKKQQLLIEKVIQSSLRISTKLGSKLKIHSERN